MAKLAKLIEQILLGRSDANIGFDELCHVLIGLGFSQRTRAAITFSAILTFWN